jgi:hypothetical protein
VPGTVRKKSGFAIFVAGAGAAASRNEWLALRAVQADRSIQPLAEPIAEKRRCAKNLIC